MPAEPPNPFIGRYVAFAAVAILINLVVQNVVLLALAGWPHAIYVAMPAGVAAGLVFKFMVDKAYVFGDADMSVRGVGRKFALYTVFGAAMTLVAFAVELSFHYAFGTVLMTNVGALVGLVIGYAGKYRLDERITFSAAAGRRGKGRRPAKPAGSRASLTRR